MDMILNKFKQDYTANVKSLGSYDVSGDFIEGTETIIDFKAAKLPLSDKDLQLTEGGTFTIDDQKIYCDKDFKNGTVITEVATKFKYTLTATRNYNIIDTGFKRYFAKRVDV